MIEKEELLKKLEALRGEPIQEFVRRDEEWNDYTEYVDSERICKNPLVSCCVFTYNQEKYIRECLDSIVAQKTDFEYEVLICEDCSTDGTLAICREFQVRYPEKVRIIHANHNYSRGALNFRRGYELALGEYIAICEGDDYWCNDKKIQLQADIMRRHPTVGLCLTESRIQDFQNKLRVWQLRNVQPGVIPGKKFFFWHIFGMNPLKDISGGEVAFIMTASTLIRRSIYKKARNIYAIFNWRLRLGDSVKWLGISSLSDVYYLPAITSVYRLNAQSVMSTAGWQVARDALVVRIWYAGKVLGMTFERALSALASLIFINLVYFSSHLSPKEQRIRANLLWHERILRKFMLSPRNFSFYMLVRLGLLQRHGVWRLSRLMLTCSPDLVKYFTLHKWYCALSKL